MKSLYLINLLFELRTHHHQMAVLCPVNHRLLTALEVNKPLSARLDVKSHTAKGNNKNHDHVALQCGIITSSTHSLPVLDHFDRVLLVGNHAQLGQGLKQVVTLQNQIPLRDVMLLLA